MDAKNLIYTLLALTRTIKQNKSQNAINEYYEPKYINVWADEIHLQFSSETDAYKELKRCLNDLVKYGYIESKLSERKTNHPYRQNTVLTYKTYLYRITEKGINKMKELAKR